MADATPLLSVKGLRFAWPGGALELDVPKLQIGPGERLACIGPSGTGKTTLLNLLTGILVPNAGEIHFDGQGLHQMSEAARRALRLERVGLVFQSFELFDWLSGRDNVLLPFLVAPGRAGAREAAARADALAEAAGIRKVWHRPPPRLSQGERQRVAICRALIGRPRLIVADEPTGNLDPHTAADVLDLLFDQVADAEASLIVVTHDHTWLDRFDGTLDMAQLTRTRRTAESAS